MASQPGPAVRQPMPPSPRRGVSKRRTRVLLVVAGAVILVLAAVPILLIQMGPDLIAGDGPLRAELAALQLPPGTTVTRELAEGNRLCLDECPVLTRWYSTTLPAGQAEQALAAALAARGFEQRGRTGSTKPGAPEMDACTSGTGPSAEMSASGFAQSCWVQPQRERQVVAAVADRAGDTPGTVFMLTVEAD